MSVSPQPRQTAAVRSPDPAAPASNPPTSLSHATLGADSQAPAALANLLSTSLQENEDLRRNLVAAERRADKAERLLAQFQKFSTPASSSPKPGSGSNTPNPAANVFDEAAARAAILESEARADRLLIEKDELTARIICMQSGWANFEEILAQQATEFAESRAQFSVLMSKRGGDLVDKDGRPIDKDRIEKMFSRPSERLSVRTGASTRAPSQPYAPAPGQSTRVRPRASSPDGYAHLTGPGGPPPNKRMRSERDYDRDLQVPQGRPYSHSVRPLYACVPIRAYRRYFSLVRRHASPTRTALPNPKPSLPTPLPTPHIPSARALESHTATPLLTLPTRLPAAADAKTCRSATRTRRARPPPPTKPSTPTRRAAGTPTTARIRPGTGLRARGAARVLRAWTICSSRLRLGTATPLLASRAGCRSSTFPRIRVVQAQVVDIVRRRTSEGSTWQCRDTLVREARARSLSTPQARSPPSPSGPGSPLALASPEAQAWCKACHHKAGRSKPTRRTYSRRP